jgi:hypothetical protein
VIDRPIAVRDAYFNNFKLDWTHRHYCCSDLFTAAAVEKYYTELIRLFATTLRRINFDVLAGNLHFSERSNQIIEMMVSAS